MKSCVFNMPDLLETVSSICSKHSLRHLRPHHSHMNSCVCMHVRVRVCVCVCACVLLKKMYPKLCSRIGSKKQNICFAGLSIM